MKKTLFLLAALGVTSGAHAAVGDTYDLTQGFIADGVAGTFTNGVLKFDKTSLQNSTRFYDSQKGWVAGSSYGDSYMCWAHTASNMIQYWQSYYGVFCKGDVSSLPYGSDYKRELYNKMNPSNSPVITDPMRLNVMKALYNSGFPNMGDEVATGTNWFFTWVDSQGGYYSEYFGAIHNGQSNTFGQTATITGINSLSTLKSALLPALGLEESNGTYTQTESGLIAHLNVTDGANPHTLTCYGLTTNADGSIKSLIIADSDDCRLPSYEGTVGSTTISGTYTPKATQLYVEVDANGKLMLYSDEACKTPFISDYAYYVSGITQINTPEVLQNMLAEYSDVANEAQVWNGNSNEWKSQVATTEELPTESTGWDVHVDGDNIAEEHRDYYHTYSTDGRNVLFGDHAAEGNRTVTINGTVSAGHIEVAAKDYRFEKGTDGAIAAGADMTVRSGASLDSEVALALGDLELEQGALLSSTETITVTGAFLTSLQESASFSLRNAVTPSVSVEADLDLREATSITLNTAVDMNGHDLFLSADTPITISLSEVDGSILFFENIGTLSVLTTDGIEVITEGMDLTQYLSITSTDGADLSGYSLVYTDGALSMSIVPEPTTATLSLLALAALTMRRRRK